MLRRQKQEQGKEIIEQAQTKLTSLEGNVQFWFTTFSIFGVLIVTGIVVLLYLQVKLLRELRKITKKPTANL